MVSQLIRKIIKLKLIIDNKFFLISLVIFGRLFSRFIPYMEIVGFDDY